MNDVTVIHNEMWVLIGTPKCFVYDSVSQYPIEETLEDRSLPVSVSGLLVGTVAVTNG